ncbi:hypothetical protein RRG08_028355 [Elysia crispata]|uniref:Uncharacterized protein n=1 Tax=Elysia crispata TaxID=231223 RepID=A0AAE1AXJ5_9GAST|nr:hypothetical protein RRG08_028355 [Elysia crispata]
MMMSLAFEGQFPFIPANGFRELKKKREKNAPFSRLMAAARFLGVSATRDVQFSLFSCRGQSRDTQTHPRRAVKCGPVPGLMWSGRSHCGNKSCKALLSIRCNLVEFERNN